jgi:hypothetical protein
MLLRDLFDILQQAQVYFGIGQWGLVKRVLPEGDHLSDVVLKQVFA